MNILNVPSSSKGFHQTPGCSCKLCKEATFTTTINNPKHPGRGFSIPKPINCLASNLVYSLSCSCGLMYVGKTTLIKPRWSNHKSHIRCGLKTCNMASHCSLYHTDSMVGKGKLSTSELVKSSLTFTLLESVGPNGSAEDLDQCEEIWRNKLNAWVPNQSINQSIIYCDRSIMNIYTQYYMVYNITEARLSLAQISLHSA